MLSGWFWFSIWVSRRVCFDGVHRPRHLSGFFLNPKHSQYRTAVPLSRARRFCVVTHAIASGAFLVFKFGEHYGFEEVFKPVPIVTLTTHNAFDVGDLKRRLSAPATTEITQRKLKGLGIFLGYLIVVKHTHQQSGFECFPRMRDNHFAAFLFVFLFLFCFGFDCTFFVFLFCLLLVR